MPHPLSHKYHIPISQLCLVNADVPVGVGALLLDTTISIEIQFELPNAYSASLFGYLCRYTKYICMLRSTKPTRCITAIEHTWRVVFSMPLSEVRFIQAVGNLKHIARQCIKSFEDQRGIQANPLIQDWY